MNDDFPDLIYVRCARHAQEAPMLVVEDSLHDLPVDEISAIYTIKYLVVMTPKPATP